MRAAAPIAFAILLGALPACGSGEDSARTDTGRSGAAPRSAPGGGKAEPTAERVIRGWSDALRAGDVNRAAGYFAVPSVVQNGTPPIRLNSRREVRAFNLSLPCGAALVRTEAAGPYVAATFRLTDRPGGQCGDGKGGVARTAFAIRNEKIVAWRRLPDESAPDEGAPPTPGRPPADSPAI